MIYARRNRTCQRLPKREVHHSLPLSWSGFAMSWEFRSAQLFCWPWISFLPPSIQLVSVWKLRCPWWPRRCFRRRTLLQYLLTRLLSRELARFQRGLLNQADQTYLSHMCILDPHWKAQRSGSSLKLIICCALHFPLYNPWPGVAGNSWLAVEHKSFRRHQVLTDHELHTRMRKLRPIPPKSLSDFLPQRSIWFCHQKRNVQSLFFS